MVTGACTSPEQPSPSPAAREAPSQSPTVSPVSVEPTLQSEGPLAHFSAEGIEFDYPGDWQVRPQDAMLRFGQVIAFVGTASSTYACAHELGPGGCTANWHLEPGSVSVELTTNRTPWGGPIREHDLPTGSTAVTIGGLPAFMSTHWEVPDADLTLSWTLSVPRDPLGTYGITAAARAPVTEALRQQLDALISSVRFEPPIVELPMGDTRDGAVARALETLSATDDSFECFPRMVGASAEATIRAIPFYSGLRRDLPVICSTNVEETPIGLWRVLLTVAWKADHDRSAGSITTIEWVDDSGGLHGGESGPHDSPPYWP
jgi:hypothetical protein